MWFGHEDTATTDQYIEADLAMKEPALRRASKLTIARWLSSKRSDYAQFRPHVVRSSTRTADVTSHCRELGIDPAMLISA
jgi:hypothetical protein